MKIFYERIKEDGLNLETSFSFKEDEDFFDVKSFNGHVDKTGDVYVLSGVMEFVFSCRCDRCLEEMSIPYKNRVDITLSPLGTYPDPIGADDKGLTDEEAGMYVTPKDHFDLNEFLRDEALLLTPIKRVCKAECKGICSNCGANLNNETCKCETVINSKMANLAKLKNNKEN